MPGSQTISPNFHEKPLSSFLRVLNVSFAMSSDLKIILFFLFDEISERGHTIKRLSFDTLTGSLISQTE